MTNRPMVLAGSKPNHDTESRVVSVHEYVLKPTVDREAFIRDVRRAEQRGLLDLAGLEEHYLLQGLRGTRVDEFAAVWIYESQEAAAALCGPPNDPKSPEEYPEMWKEWENDVLDPFLVGDPDDIDFTAYRVL